jgi:protein TonB
MATVEISFHADPAQRPALWSRSPIEPSRRVAITGATLLYALLFAGLTADYRFAPARAPIPQEIPVEIVPEPEPPPPPPQAQQPPAPKPIVEPEQEKPAYDAPRAGTAEHDTDVVGKSEKEPPAPAPTPPPDQKPDKPQDNPKPAEAAAKDETKPPDSQSPSPEAPPAPVADGETPPPQVAKADPNPPAQAPPKFSLPASALASIPDVEFGAPAMKSPVSGGQARSRYLTILVGLIRPHIHQPAGLQLKGGNSRVSVAFAIDAKGRLTDRWVLSPSGSPELDAAVFEAIAAASPFPPPPQGRAEMLEFHYGAD